MTRSRDVEVASTEAERGQRVPLPEEVELRGEIADVAKEGLLAFAAAAGLAVVQEVMEHEVGEVVGPRGRHDNDRAAKRTVTRAARRRWAVGVCRSAARGSGPPTTALTPASPRRPGWWRP